AGKLILINNLTTHRERDVVFLYLTIYQRLCFNRGRGGIGFTIFDPVSMHGTSFRFANQEQSQLQITNAF
ncbi:hypothetical protein KJ978_01710, partial [Patescibacteria group bacterium]|nr:hypothetical protein [Patescibacteria group bacterium]